MKLPAPLLCCTSRAYTLSHLFEAHPIDPTAPNERRLLTQVLPPWQRPEVWSVSQKRRFIEGIFLGLGTGSYVVNGADFGPSGEPLPCSGWLLDGQQRISAIRDFVQGHFSVFEGIAYADLDRPTQRIRFLSQVFPCHELAYTRDEQALRDIYDRLNFSGVAHTPSQRVVSPMVP